MSYHRKTGKWRAAIVINWKQQHLGLFETPDAAHQAYCAAADALHRDFANYGAVAL